MRKPFAAGAEPQSEALLFLSARGSRCANIAKPRGRGQRFLEIGKSFQGSVGKFYVKSSSSRPEAFDLWVRE